VRQLENICHWLTVMAPAQLVDAHDLPPELQGKTVVPNGHASSAGESAARSMPALSVAHDAGAPPAERTTVPQREADAGGEWISALERRARELLGAGEPMVWDTLTREFEAQLIRSALATTRGRRIEAALKLGIGRNTITRKIQELGLDEK
ncbi:MAG: nitrogen regulation protein NR(I), partial [Rhizobacter sp.]|nr:nitrogen regulation protein NR(I) [Rhizobacter sp.]